MAAHVEALGAQAPLVSLNQFLALRGLGAVGGGALVPSPLQQHHREPARCGMAPACLMLVGRLWCCSTALGEGSGRRRQSVPSCRHHPKARVPTAALLAPSCSPGGGFHPPVHLGLWAGAANFLLGLLWLCRGGLLEPGEPGHCFVGGALRGWRLPGPRLGDHRCWASGARAAGRQRMWRAAGFVLL